MLRLKKPARATFFYWLKNYRRIKFQEISRISRRDFKFQEISELPGFSGVVDSRHPELGSMRRERCWGRRK